MRIGFAGTPGFAAAHLQALIQAGGPLKPVMVLTQPDRAAGRGLVVQPSPVRQLAQAHDILVWTPRRLKPDDPDGVQALEALVAAELDWLVVVAYGLILPAPALQAPRLGCLNVHASLLPRWRGAAPIQRAIEAGDRETGVCLMQMEAGLDTGPVWRRHTIDIQAEDNAQTLQDRLADLGSTALCDFLRQPRAPGEQPEAQNTEGITYAHKIGREDRLLRLDQTAEQAWCQVRSLDPSPGLALQTSWFGPGPQSLIKVSQASLVEPRGRWGLPGTILRLPKSEQDPLVLACAEGLLGLHQLQKPGGKRLSAAVFARGSGLTEGQTL